MSEIVLCDKNGNSYEIKLSGRINTSNAKQVEEEIFSSFPADVNNVVIDAKDLEFISSSGLRVLLKIKLQVEDTSIINVSQGVYDILEVTGFTEVLKVKTAF